MYPASGRITDSEMMFLSYDGGWRYAVDSECFWMYARLRHAMSWWNSDQNNCDVIKNQWCHNGRGYVILIIVQYWIVRYMDIF